MANNTVLFKETIRRFTQHFGREPLAVGVVDGICWATARSLVVGINGYVLIPAKGHPWSAGFPDDFDADTVLDAHGGITWQEHPWIGFDTAHAGDWWAPEYDPRGMSELYQPPGFGAKKWTPTLVQVQAERLAIQVARIGLQAARYETQQQPSRFRHLDIIEERNTP